MKNRKLGEIPFDKARLERRIFAKKFLELLVPLVLFPLILGLMAIEIISDSSYRTLAERTALMNDQMQGSFQDLMEEFASLSEAIDANPVMLNWVASTLTASAAEEEKIEKLTAVDMMLDSILAARNYVDSIYLFIDNPHMNFINYSGNSQITSIYRAVDISWYGAFAQKRYSPEKVWAEMRMIRTRETSESYQVLSVYCKVDRIEGVRDQGFIVFNLLMSELTSMIDGIANPLNKYIFVLSPENRVVMMSSNTDSLFENPPYRFDYNEYSMFTPGNTQGYTVEENPLSSIPFLKYVAISSQTEWKGITKQIEAMTFIVFIMATLTGLTMAFWITKKDLGYIYEILNILDHAQHGENLPLADNKRTDEYGYIINSILNTFVEHSYLALKDSENKYRLHVFELTALQAQINPHFLFNTLQTISWKACTLTGGKMNECNAMIDDLADILHYSLGQAEGENSLVTLEQEVQNARNYLSIQRIRYGEKFEVTWDVDERLFRHVRIIKLILQPLLENAIYHGIKPLPGNGRITIAIWEEDQRVTISIADTGVGMSAEQLQVVRSNLNSGKESAEHIGLNNVYRRLCLIYGETLHFSLKSGPGLGTCVRIVVPYIPPNTVLKDETGQSTVT